MHPFVVLLAALAGGPRDAATRRRREPEEELPPIDGAVLDAWRMWARGETVSAESHAEPSVGAALANTHRARSAGGQA